ncbi:MAG: sulfotransferase, partial [Candidatus Aquilonibacter sp.]
MRLFILGPPRSGTTVVGNFVASHAQCYNLGEYYGFYLALRQAPQLMHRMPSTVLSEYLSHLFVGTLNFADACRDSAGAAMWCDQTPFNLQIARELVERLPDAVFLLMLRHYRGVIQSLRRSYATGYRWAGSRIQD